MELTGTEVKMRRERLGLSHDRLAQRLDVTPRTIFRWENGVSRIAHPGMLDLALTALDVEHEAAALMRALRSEGGADVVIAGPRR